MIIEDETTLQLLSFMSLENHATLTDDAPEGISGEGYLITRFYEDSRSPGRFIPFDEVRYYADPLTIYGESYFLCSQWFEVSANNDRPYLLKWLEEHD